MQTITCINSTLSFQNIDISPFPGRSYDALLNKTHEQPQQPVESVNNKLSKRIQSQIIESSKQVTVPTMYRNIAKRNRSAKRVAPSFRLRKASQKTQKNLPAIGLRRRAH